MRLFECQVARSLFLCGSLALAACGGGGGDGGSTGASALTPFADLNQTTVPEGTRLDVSTLNLFPFDAGDQVVYDRSTSGVVNGTVTRTFSAPAGATSLFYVTETDSTAPTVVDQTTYVVATITGTDLHVQIQDPLGAAGTAPGLFNRIPTLEEYTAPLYPVGGTTLLEVQGNLGADADSDGKTDSYRFTYSQVFRGFETLTVLGSSRQVAHFSNAGSLTLRFTSGKADSTASNSEETYFAPGIGLVKRESGVGMLDGVVTTPAYSIQARSATVAGVSYP